MGGESVALWTTRTHPGTRARGEGCGGGGEEVGRLPMDRFCFMFDIPRVRSTQAKKGKKAATGGKKKATKAASPSKKKEESEEEEMESEEEAKAKSPKKEKKQKQERVVDSEEEGGGGGGASESEMEVSDEDGKVRGRMGGDTTGH